MVLMTNASFLSGPDHPLCHPITAQNRRSVRQGLGWCTSVLLLRERVRIFRLRLCYVYFGKNIQTFTPSDKKERSTYLNRRRSEQNWTRCGNSDAGKLSSFLRKPVKIRLNDGSRASTNELWPSGQARLVASATFCTLR